MTFRTIRTTLFALIGALTLAAAAGAQQGPATSLTIEELMAAAEAANPELESLALQRENARVTFDRATAAADARLDRITATLQWERAQLSARQGRTRELLAIAQAYVDLQQANEEVSVLEERLRLAQLDLQLTDTRVEMGAAGAVDQLQAQVAELNAELNLAAARNQRRFTTLPALAEKSGLDAAALEAAGLDSEPPELPELGPPDSYATATARRPEHRHAAQQLEIDELNHDLLSAEETSRLDLETSANTLASSRAAVESTAADLQTATASAYATARQAFGTVTLRELQLALQRERTQRAEEQFGAGMITQSTLAGSQADLTESDNALRAAHWSAYFSWLRLRDAAGLAVPLAEVE